MARAGKFRELVTFQQLVDGDASGDGYGNSLDTWGGDVARWADVIERPGRERVQGGVMADNGTATVRVRSDSTSNTIGTDWRVYMRGQYWDIESALQVDRKGAVLEFLVSEGSAA